MTRHEGETGKRAEWAAIGRNAASSYGFRAVRAASVLLITPYLFRRLGPAGFGTWGVMFSIATIFNLLEVGVSAGVSKYVAEYAAQARRRELEATLGAAVFLMGLLGVGAVAISAAIAFLAPALAADGERGAFQAGLLVLGAAMLFRFPCVAYASALLGYQRYDLFNLAEALSVLGFAAGAIVAIETGSGIFGLAVAYAAALVAGGAAFAVLLARTDRQLSLRPRLTDARTRRQVAGFGSWALVADSMDFMAQRMDTVLIAAIRGAVAAAPMAAATRLISGLQGLVLSFVHLLPPMVSDLQARGRHEDVVQRFLLATRLALQITLPLAVGFSLFAVDIVRAWLGPSAPPVTAAIVVVLMAVQVFTLTSVPAQQVLIGLGRVRMIGGLAAIEGVANLACSLWLIWTYGAIGAALGTLLTSALIVPVACPLACRVMGCSVGRFLREGIVPAVASSIAAVAVMTGIFALLPAGALRLVIGLTLGIAVAAAVAVAQTGAGRSLAALRALRG